MTPEEMIERIDRETGPDKMSMDGAWDWLIELKSLIDSRLEALDCDMRNTEESNG